MKVLVSLFILLCIGNIVNAQKAIPFNQTKEHGIDAAELDSTYRSGIHADTSKAVFKTNQDEYIAAYQQLLQDFGKFLNDNGFVWEKPAHGFNRIYFDRNGHIDYFLYSFRTNQVTPEQEEEFGRLLQRFISNYTFALTAEEGFAQCSPVTYMPAKE